MESFGEVGDKYVAVGHLDSQGKWLQVTGRRGHW